MQKLPYLHANKRVNFNNILSGKLYNNQKYAFQVSNNPQQSLQQTKSIIFKSQSIINQKSQSLQKSMNNIRKSDIFNLTKRLSSHIRPRCTKSQWFQYPQNQNEQKGKSSKQISLSKNIKQQTLRLFNKRQLFAKKQITILNFVNEIDISKKLKIDLKKYFEMFFNKQLSGIMFSQLIQIVDKYILHALQLQQKYSHDNKVKQQSNNLNITSKRLLFQKLKEYQDNQLYQQLYSLILKLCLPNKELRTIFLKDVLDLIGSQIFQIYNMSKSIQYELLNQFGRPIQDFAQIGFLSTKLFLSIKDKSQEYYAIYVNYLKNQFKLSNKYSFRQSLKQNFRKNITAGKYDDSKPIFKVLENSSQNKWKSKIIKNSMSRSKVENMRKSKQKLIKQSQTFINKQQFKNKLNTSFYSIDAKIIQQFRQLKKLNDYSNTILKNQQKYKDYIEINILKQNCIFFKTKTKEQIQKILSAFNLTNIQPIKIQKYNYFLINIQKYKKIRHIISCLAGQSQIFQFVHNYLKFDQYGQLDKQKLQNILQIIVGQGKSTCVVVSIIWQWLNRNGAIVNDVMRQDQMKLLYQKNKLVYYLIISLIFGTNQVTTLDLTQQILI